MELSTESLYAEANIFAQHIVIAIDCLDQSHAMSKIFCDPRFSSRSKDAPHFFWTAYNAMRFRFEIEVNKLFDQNKKSKSFDLFKDFLAQNNIVSPDYLAAYKNAKRAAKKDIDQIHVRRNQIHAHTDIKTFYNPDTFSEEHPFHGESIRKLLICMLNLCNMVIFNHTKVGAAQLYGISNSDDFVKLFGCETESDKRDKDILETWGI